MLDGVGKRFGREWIFRDLSQVITPGQHCAVLGPNGSGKSTSLQLIAASASPSKGHIFREYRKHQVKAEDIYALLTFSSPYIDLPEELTLSELIAFHFRFKKVRAGMSGQQLIQLANLEGNEHKAIKHFSSGMRQRLKLLLSIMSDVPLLLLDEPCTNLDMNGISWYRNLVKTYCDFTTVIIASNQPHEYDFCGASLDITRFKPAPKAG